MKLFSVSKVKNFLDNANKDLQRKLLNDGDAERIFMNIEKFLKLCVKDLDDFSMLRILFKRKKCIDSTYLNVLLTYNNVDVVEIDQDGNNAPMDCPAKCINLKYPIKNLKGCNSEYVNDFVVYLKHGSEKSQKCIKRLMNRLESQFRDIDSNDFLPDYMELSVTQYALIREVSAFTNIDVN